MSEKQSTKPARLGIAAVLAILGIAVGGIALAATYEQPALAATMPEVASSPSACATSNVLNQVTESSAGALVLSCIQLAFSDISGTANFQTQLSNFPSGCAAFNYITTLAVTPTCGQPIFNTRVTVAQTATTATFKSTTLTIALAANTNYNFEAYVFATTTATSSLQMQVHALAAGAALIAVCGEGNVATSTSWGSGCTQATGANIFGASSTATVGYFILSGTVTVGANPTTLQIDFNDPLGAGTTTIAVGSFISAQPVA